MTIVDQANFFHFSERSPDIQDEIFNPVLLQIQEIQRFAEESATSDNPLVWMLNAVIILKGIVIGLKYVGSVIFLMPNFMLDLGFGEVEGGNVIVMMFSGIVYVVYALGIMQLLGKWNLGGGYK